MAYRSQYPTHHELLELQKQIPKHLPFSPMEKELTALSLLVFVLSSLYFFIHWQQIDGLVPTHFGFDGQPDAWGDKYSLLGVLAVYLLLMLLLTIVQFFPKYWNFPFRINEAHLLEALHHMRFMLAACTLLASLLMGYLLLESLWGSSINLFIMIILFALMAAVIIGTIRRLKQMTP